MASAFADIDKVAISWRTRFIITAILLVIPLIVAIPVAVFSELILVRLGFPDRSRFRLFHLVPVAVLAFLPVFIVWGWAIPSLLQPDPITKVTTTIEPGTDQPLGDSDSAGFCAPIEVVLGDSIFLIVSIRSPREVDSEIKLLTDDQEGRRFFAQGTWGLAKGINRIHLTLLPSPESDPQPMSDIAWPLEVVNAIVMIPGSEENGHIRDARWGSLAYIYPDHVVTPAAPTATPTPP